MATTPSFPRKAAGLLGALALAAGLVACGNESGSTDGATGVEDGTFTVGFDANFPPYGYSENGEYTGFDLDLAQEVADRNEWELVKQPIDWNAKDMELSSGTIDAIWNGFTIDGREDAYTWSKPYVDSAIVFIVKKDSGISALDDLAGKNVLVQADSSGLDAIQSPENADLKNSFAELTEVPDYNNAFMNIEAGAADAVIVDQNVAHYQLKERGDDNFVQLDEGLRSEQYGIGFKLGNTKLRDEVEAALDQMRADGTFQKIAEEYGLEDSIVTEN